MSNAITRKGDAMPKRSIELVAEDNDFFRTELITPKTIDFEDLPSLSKDEREQLVEAIKRAKPSTKERQVGLCDLNGQPYTWVIMYLGRANAKSDPFAGPCKRALKVLSGARA